MAKARREQVNLDSTPYYHVMSRCVRRAYLCGKDKETGRDFSHRKQWIVDRMYFLSSIFAIDIAAYAVMDNHYHLVLHVVQDRADEWNDDEILERGSLLFRNIGKKLKKIMDLNPLHPFVIETLKEWRARFKDISWFMRCMNENIARNSNKEDKCKGRFWECRFKSQALLDEGALLSAMAYVDLNPIRACLSDSLEDSEFTSIKARIEACRRSGNNLINETKTQPVELMNFNTCNNTASKLSTIDFKLEDYLQLVDETGRIMREDKRGAISTSSAPILSSLNLSTSGWLSMTKELETQFGHVVGHEDKIMGFSDYLVPPKGTTASREHYKSHVA